jgi:hypothetical protein
MYVAESLYKDVVQEPGVLGSHALPVFFLAKAHDARQGTGARIAFCAGFSATILQKPAYKRCKTCTSTRTHYITICALYNVLRTQNCQYFPEQSKIKKSPNPETHHKHIIDSTLNAENSQLSNGANPIPLVILLSECAAIYCSGVSYPGITTQYTSQCSRRKAAPLTAID